MQKIEFYLSNRTKPKYFSKRNHRTDYLSRCNTTKNTVSCQKNLEDEYPRVSFSEQYKDKLKLKFAEQPINNNPENRKDPITNIEIYYFDHGNSAYFHTTDCPPQLSSDKLAQITQDTATRFWAELYGSIHIVIAFMVAFLLQSYRYYY